MTMIDFDAASLAYSGDDVKLLSEMEGVRTRPGMYIGPTNSTGLHHLIWEIVDNSVDEALNGFGDKVTVTICKDGSCMVEDEGRGIPTDINSETGLPAVQLLFTTLHSGGKFSEKNYTTSSGLHGVGATVTNALSEWIDITVYRLGQIHHIRFENGGNLVTPLEVIGTTRKHGSVVRFKPDATIFSTVEFKWDTIYHRLQERAFLLKKVHFILKDERSGKVHEFFYPNGLSEYISILNENKSAIGEVINFEGEVVKEIGGKPNTICVDVAMQWCLEDYNENIYSYANSVRTNDGGTHETGLRLAITRAVQDWAVENKLIKDAKAIDGNDIREGVTAIISVKVPEALSEYESQTKNKLASPEVLPAVNGFVYDAFIHYLAEHKDFAVDLVKKCLASRSAREAARRAKAEARNGKQKKVEAVISDKLAAAQSKDYRNNELFIVEGDSAGGSAKSGRDRSHQAILPLRGKPMNTDGVPIERIRQNVEFQTIIQTIGAGFGADFDVEDSHYGKIIIMTDADVDGAHIQILLLTFFYNYMKPLITHGMVYVACPPLYGVFKKSDKSKVIYAYDDASLADAKKKLGPGCEVKRYKGLGEMNADQLYNTTMCKATRRLYRVEIVDPLIVEQRISTLMGNDPAKRREWIEENVVFNEVDEFIEEVKG